MRRENDPMGMMSNPLMGAFFHAGDTEDSDEVLMLREKDREREIRLLGTMLFHAVFLSLCILLYDRWEWSQFQNSYEAMVFWFTASFALQAGFYFIYRAMFEDSNTHRKNLRRMRQGNRRRLAQLKYNQEKVQLEQVLNQQLGMFQQTMSHAMADGVIDANEQQVLTTQSAEIEATQQALQVLQQLGFGDQSKQQSNVPSPTPSLTPETLGIDRHRIMGIPVGPSLSVNPVANNPIPQEGVTFDGGPAQQGNLNLIPSGTQQEKIQEQADQMESAVNQ